MRNKLPNYGTLFIHLSYNRVNVYAPNRMRTNQENQGQKISNPLVKIRDRVTQ